MTYTATTCIDGLLSFLMPGKMRRSVRSIHKSYTRNHIEEAEGPFILELLHTSHQENEKTYVYVVVHTTAFLASEVDTACF